MNQLRQLETFARAGWFARGVVYGLLGYLAIATGRGGANGPNAVFDHIREMPAGSALLLLLIIGLTFYGAFRLYGAAMDSEGNGRDAKGVAIRVGHAASGIAHFLLAWIAVKLLTSNSSGSSGVEADAARVVLDLPFGGMLLGLAGLAFLAATAHQAKKSWNASFMDDMDAGAPALVKPIGQAGTAARAIVFAIIGYSLMRAGWFSEAEEVKGLGEVFSGLRGEPIIYALVAMGLLLFGLFSLIQACWGRICNEDVVARLKTAAH